MSETGELSVLQRALLAIKDLRARLAVAEAGAREPIAVVGLACRFPGAPDSRAFWRLLHEGRDAVREVPADRWDAAALYHPDPGHPGTTCTRQGGFLDAVDRFDARFFGISPREAARMDPQHRLLLEVAWEALESAGQTQDGLAGSATGVFVGVSVNDYAQLIRRGGPAALDPYFAGGNALNAAAGRLSYTFGLRGPCAAVDAACASSLVAVHLACQSLRTGESELALAAGVNLILAPDAHVAMSRARALAPDGRCKTFDARADGYGRGEGCGVVVLRRLADARAAGDPILAVIRGSAVQQDGRSSGLTVPNGEAQQAVIRAALAAADVRPDEVGYVEAHGTGTSLGDPIEVRAVAATLGEGRGADRPLHLGSVKTNIGHLESAAGVAGLIKVVLALRARELPPHLHLEAVNPDLDLAAIPAVIPTAPTPWPALGGRRLAGVSAFGLTGTIAHAVVEEGPAEEAPAAAAAGPFLLPITARDSDALAALAAAHRELLAGEGAPAAADVCRTAALRRTHHDHRLAVVGVDRDELCANLAAFAAGETRPGVVAARRPPDRRRLVFVFPGQGGQWRGMARDLLEREPAFRSAIESCDRALAPVTGWSLAAVLAGAPGAPAQDEIDAVQPAIFGVQVGLAALWRSWGVAPDAVVGHSMGEVAAAHVAGILSLEDAARVIGRRSRLLRRTAGRGAMAVVELGLAETERALGARRDRVSVAAANAPRSTVISGEPGAVAEILAELERDGVFCRAVKVDVASHSPQMDPLRGELLAALAGLSPGTAAVPFYSTVEAARVAGDGCGPEYWARNLREPVLLLPAVERLLEDGHDLYLELSPHPTLVMALGECLRDRAAVVVPSLRRDEPARPALLAALGALWANGQPLDWGAVAPAGRATELPSYPWQRERHWLDDVAAAGAPPARPFPGERIDSPAVRGALFRTELSARALPFLDDHRIDGELVVPGAFHLALTVAAAGEAFGEAGCAVDDVQFPSALVLAAGEAREAQLCIDEAGGFRILSRPPGEATADAWTVHAAGRVRAAAPAPATPLALDEIRARCDERRSGEDFYREMWDAGYHLGPTFRWVEEVHAREGEVLGRLRTPEGADAEDYAIYPGFLDSCFQLVGVASRRRGVAGVADTDSIYVPVGVTALRFRRPPRGELWCHVVPRKLDGDEALADVRLCDASGELLCEVGFRGKRVARGTFLHGALAARPEDWLLGIDWAPAPAVTGAAAGRWLLLADRGGAGRALARRLEARGGSCVLRECEPGEDPAAVAERAVADAGACRGVVHLWSLDAPALAALDGASLALAQRRGCGALVRLVQTLGRDGGPPPRLYLVTAGVHGDATAPAAAPLWGLARTIAHERPELRCSCVDLGGDELDLLADELAADDREDQLVLRGGRRLAARLARVSLDATPAAAAADSVAAGDAPYRLEIPTPGVLENLTLRPVPRDPPGPGEVELEVRAAGINFVDVLSALGVRPDRVDGPTQLGGECAGVVTAVGPGVTGLAVGDEVVALAAHCFRRWVVASERFVVKKPARIDFVGAATLPIAFMTAHWAMFHKGRLRPGETILIHAASGGVGLAAVQLARWMGLEIFATAGSPEKRQLLRDLGIRHVFDSRTLVFADEVMAATGGRGVDAVLNCLTGDALARSLDVLAPHGRFLEIGKRDIYQDRQLGLAPFRRNLSYFAVDLIRMFGDRPDDTAALLREIVGLVADGTLEPLAVTAFPISRAVDAFRLMAQARHVGKVVLTMPDPDARVAAAPAAGAAIRPDATYLVTGGLGGLGLEVARWLCAQGARHLALVGRSAPSPEARAAVAELEAGGARVLVAAADVADAAALDAVLARIDAELPPLRGVVHAAGVLDDGLLAALDADRLYAVLRPKVAGGWNLHAATRGRKLDLFVLFSGAAALLGSPGQGNYAAANAFLGGLARARRAAGLPALAIDWGPWSEVGLAARPDRAGRLALRGVGSLSPGQGIAALARLLAAPAAPAQLGVVPLDLRQCFAAYPALADAPLFARLAAEAVPGAAAPPADAPFRRALAEAPEEQRLGLLEGHLREQAARVLGLSPARLEVDRPLGSFGFDSLMTLDLRNRLEASLGLKLSATLVWNHPTLTALAAHLARKLDLPVALAAGSTPPAPPNGDARAAIEALSEDEAAAALAARLANLEGRGRA